MEEVWKMNVEKTLERIETKLDRALLDICDHDNRLRILENKNGMKWEQLVGQIIALGAVGFVGWLLGSR